METTALQPLRSQPDTLPGFRRDWGQLILLCPRCGGECLHHEAVEWWTRNREDGESEVEILGSVSMGYVSDQSHNPSSRRDGLRIRFWCEFGCRVPPLDIAQHKGSTLVSWGAA